MDRLALLLLGTWIGLVVASSAVATVNFRTVDRLLGPELRPELGQRLAPLAPEDRRFAFRHLASEVNRRVFRSGSLVQLALAAAFVALAWPLGRGLRALALAALLIVAVQALGLAGAITSFGRPLDFVPRPLPEALARRFALLHGAYVIGELAKLALLAAAAFLLLRRPAA